MTEPRDRTRLQVDHLAGSQPTAPASAPKPPPTVPPVVLSGNHPAEPSEPPINWTALAGYGGALVGVLVLAAMLFAPRQPVMVQQAEPEQSEPVPEVKNDTLAAEIDLTLQQLVAEAERQQAQILCVRVADLLDKARAELEANGTPLEVSLARAINYQSSVLLSEAAEQSRLGGDPESVAQARARVGDSYAMALALRMLRENQPIESCQVAIAPLIRDMRHLSGLLVAERQSILEQQIRNQELLRQDAQQAEHRTDLPHDGMGGAEPMQGVWVPFSQEQP